MTKDAIKTQEIQILDSEGNTRIILSANGEEPFIKFVQNDGSMAALMTVNKEGYPAVKLYNPDTTLPTTLLEVDSKGTHIKFNHPKGANSYLFLNNEGTSGLVMIDQNKKRQYDILVNQEGEVRITNNSKDGK